MKVKIEGGIFKTSLSCEFYENPGEIKFFAGVSHSFGCNIFLAEHTIETEIPDVDTTEIEINALKEAIKKEKADSYVRIMAFENAIQKLLCIENNPTSE